MNDKDQLFKNLISILKLFKNRPYHLAKYLIENEAFNDEFLKKLLESEKLNQITEGESKDMIKSIYFVDISHMNEFFNSFTNDIGKKFDKNITDEINKKLDQCLKDEKYEDAIRIRDYMAKNNIKRISKDN